MQLALVSWLVPAILRLIGCTLRETTTYEEGAIQSLTRSIPASFPSGIAACFPRPGFTGTSIRR